MNITDYTAEVIKRCEPINEGFSAVIRGTESMIYGVDTFYEFLEEEPYSSLSLVNKYNVSLKTPFSKKEEIQIASTSGIPGVLTFMIMFFLNCKKQDANFSVYDFLLKHGVIKNTLINDFDNIKIDD